MVNIIVKTIALHGAPGSPITRRSRTWNRRGAYDLASAGGIATAKLINGFDLHARLADTLTKLINSRPASSIDELLPWAYA